MKFKKITIHCTKEDTYQTLIDKIKKAFDYPSLFGSNVNALIEGFLLLRFPSETFASFYLDIDETVLLELKNTSSLKYELLNFLILAIESANSVLNDKDLPPSVYLLVI